MRRGTDTLLAPLKFNWSAMQTLKCTFVLGGLFKICLYNDHFHPKILKQLVYRRKSETARHNALPLVRNEIAFQGHSVRPSSTKKGCHRL